MNIEFIGLGTIAECVATDLAKAGYELIVSRRSEARSAALATAFGVSVAENQEVAEACDLVFIGTTAEAAPGALGPVKFRAGQRVISLMVGIEPEDLAGLVAPATVEAMMIPFPAIAEGCSPVLVWPKSQVLNDIFEARHQLIPMQSRAAMGDFLAAQAVLSPTLKMLGTASAWLGERSGDGHGAEQFLRLLVGGALMDPPMDREGLIAGLLSALDTPGGLNQQLRQHMENAGTYEVLIQGLDSLSQRMKGG